MNDEQIKEVMRLADEIADYAWKQGLSDGAYSQSDHDRKSCDASRAELEAYLRTIGEPESVNAELLAIVHRTVGMIENTSIETGCCCCGDGMDGHASPMICGHSATDQGAYLADLLYEDAKAAIARAESSIEGSPKPVTFPAMKAAFRTTRVEAGEFIMAFKFRDIEDMDRADDEWRAAMAIETPAKVSPCAGQAWQAAHLAGQRAMQARAAKLLGDAAENRRKSPRPHYGIPFAFEKAKEEVLALEVKP